MRESVPSDAKCAVHPLSPAIIICARCGSFACASCSHAAADGGWYCARCEESAPQPLASRGARFAANLVDNFAVMAPAVVIFAVGLALVRSPGERDEREVFVSLGAMLGILVGVGAQVWAQLQWGQSLGKRLLSIKVVRLSGGPIELWRLILLRNVALHAVSQLCGLIGLVDALLIFGADQRCLHDYFADSKVIAVVKE